MTATRGRAVFLRQVQRGFTYAGFLFVFSGIGGFLLLLIAPAPIERLIPIILLTAILVRRSSSEIQYLQALWAGGTPDDAAYS
jgi:hypothetical protein